MVYYAVLATFNIKNAKTSGEAMDYVHKRLREHSFIKWDTFFENSKYLPESLEFYHIGHELKINRFAPYITNCKKPYVHGADLINPNDAVILNKSLYNEFLKKYEGENGTEVPFDYDHGHCVDLDDEKISPSFIGKKWLVIIDCLLKSRYTRRDFEFE